MFAAAAQDIRFGKISNRLIAAGLMTGMVFQVMEYQVWGIWFFLGNISIPIILLYLLFQMRVLGAGDIKLFSMIGSILTAGELLRCMAYSFMAAGAGAVFVLAADRERRRRLGYAFWYISDFLHTRRVKPYLKAHGAEKFAFAVPVFFGTALALYFPAGRLAEVCIGTIKNCIFR